MRDTEQLKSRARSALIVDSVNFRKEDIRPASVRFEAIDKQAIYSFVKSMKQRGGITA